jgi:mono/diheme cytochrome c family protein
MKRWILAAVVIVVLSGVAAIFVFTQFDLSALQEPGKAETFLATQAKRILIYKSSRSGIPSPPNDLQASVEQGETLYGTDCAMCHGSDGHTLTDNGRWMYPRASDLTSPSVQQYSDHELFWIIKNGIRLSGMPGFGKVESDEHIWDLVRYVRTLPGKKKE